MSDSRADRMRKRRQQSQSEQPDESDTSKPSEPSEQSEPDEPAETGEQDESDEQSVKDEQVGTYMYLPESQTKALTNTYNLLKAKYEAEYDEPFEKNRHFFPLVVEYGLDRLDGADASDVRELLDEL